MKIFTLSLFLCLCCFDAGAVEAADAAPAAVRQIAIDRAGIVIKNDVRIQPGVWRVTDGGDEGVLIVKRKGVTIDFNGAELLGCAEGAERDTFAGIGVVCVGCDRVTIKNARIGGFKTAILVEKSDGVIIEDCDLSHNYAQRLKSTPEREDGSDWLWPHENDDDQWRKNYGAGIYMKECAKAVVRRNRGYGSQNGLVLARVNDSDIYDNDFSFNSGWGLAMWRSCENRVSHNKFDWCVRGYSHGVYWRGQDSTGILFFEQCSDNFFGWNSATHGGDGFFLYAGNETLRRTGKGGCNRNVLYKNDFSHAVANGIEATFSDDNKFIENLCNDCQHGFWLGYSYNNEVVGNEIMDCAGAGIAWEHGSDNLIEGNLFGRNSVAVDLWWDDDKDLIETPYGKRHNTACEKNLVKNNCFGWDKIGIRLREAKKTQIVGNTFLAVGTPVSENDKCSGTTKEKNLTVPERDGTTKEVSIAKHSRQYTPPKTEGSMDAFLPEGALRGRQYILIDEWGPYDFKKPKDWPSAITAGGEGTFYVYGPEAEGDAGRFVVGPAPDGIGVSPESGAIPGQFTVRAEEPGLHTFEIEIVAGGETLRARGSLLNVEWTVDYFHWDPAKDPREDQAAWDGLLKSEPAHTAVLDELRFNWGGGAPAVGLNADHFGTRATATLRLPAGKYQFTTISDDGIRLWIDGTLAIDNWTWHAPTEDRAELSLDAGRHDFRIEHFEIDGHAALSFAMKKMLPE